jgi:hypothetical protein
MAATKTRRCAARQGRNEDAAFEAALRELTPEGLLMLADAAPSLLSPPELAVGMAVALRNLAAAKRAGAL